MGLFDAILPKSSQPSAQDESSKKFDAELDSLFKTAPKAVPVPKPSLSLDLQAALSEKRLRNAQDELALARAIVRPNKKIKLTEVNALKKEEAFTEQDEQPLKKKKKERHRKLKKLQLRTSESVAEDHGEVQATQSESLDVQKQNQAEHSENVVQKEDSVPQQEETPQSTETTEQTQDATTEKEETRKQDDPEKLARTLFVGNLPSKTVEHAGTKLLKRKFAEYGPIESIRFRSIAFEKPIPRRIGFITKRFHPDAETVNAYIVFKSADFVEKALEANGYVFKLTDEDEGRHIRVDRVTAPSKDNSKDKLFDPKKTVFVGNLTFTVSNESIWKFFSQVGDVVNVRVVRDKKTQVGKGFAYVSFKDRSSVSLALKLNNQEFESRPIRVQKCSNPEKMQQNAREGEHAKKGAVKLKKKKSTKEGTAKKNVESARRRKSAKDMKKALQGMGKMKKTKQGQK